MSSLLSAFTTPRTPQPEELNITPQLGYKRCLCLGVLPGRACPMCFGTKWLKKCHECNGAGVIFKNARNGQEPRPERCGFCMAKGWLGAKPADKPAIAEQESGIRAVKHVAEAKLVAPQIIPPAKTRSRSRKAQKTRRGRKPSEASQAIMAARTGQIPAHSSAILIDPSGIHQLPEAQSQPQPVQPSSFSMDSGDDTSAE